MKVRETDTAGTHIGEVGNRGATNISSLSFEIDDVEALKEAARLIAIADAKEQAENIAKELGERLGDVISFNEGGGYYPQPYETRAMSLDMAFEESAVKAAAPEIAVGEDAITARVTVTYELK